MTLTTIWLIYCVGMVVILAIRSDKAYSKAKLALKRLDTQNEINGNIAKEANQAFNEMEGRIESLEFGFRSMQTVLDSFKAFESATKNATKTKRTTVKNTK